MCSVKGWVGGSRVTPSPTILAEKSMRLTLLRLGMECINVGVSNVRWAFARTLGKRKQRWFAEVVVNTLGGVVTLVD